MISEKFPNDQEIPLSNWSISTKLGISCVYQGNLPGISGGAGALAVKRYLFDSIWKTSL